MSLPELVIWTRGGRADWTLLQGRGADGGTVHWVGSLCDQAAPTALPALLPGRAADCPAVLFLSKLHEPQGGSLRPRQEAPGAWAQPRESSLW